MSPAPGVPVCEGCGHIIRPYEQARAPEWHAECLNKQEPMTITVSCCAECPWCLVRTNTSLECMVRSFEGYNHPDRGSCGIEDPTTRPSWCPLPITVKAEEG